MQKYSTARVVLAGAIFAGLAAAQSEPGQCGEGDPADAVVTGSAPTYPAYAPLDLKQKYLYSFNEMAAPARWIGFALHAAMDQAQKSPSAWGEGPDSFGVRLASRFGRSFMRENIAFGVRALDGEDPRYFVLGRGSRMARTKYAFMGAFMTRRDDGGSMPAYSRFVANLAMPMIAQMWRPEKFSLERGFRAGAGGIGLEFGSNLWQEFAPDLKQRVKQALHHGR